MHGLGFARPRGRSTNNVSAAIVLRLPRMNLDWLHAGGPVMYALVVCSVVSVTITIERFIFFARDRSRRQDKHVERLVKLLSEGASERAIELTPARERPRMRADLEALGIDRGPASEASS